MHDSRTQPRISLSLCAFAIALASVGCVGLGGPDVETVRSAFNRAVFLHSRGELDAAIVVEPARIIRDERNGLRSLYVALTRATRRLAIVHAEPLPTALLEPVALGAG